MSSLTDRLHSVLGTENLNAGDIVVTIPVEDQAIVLADNEISQADIVIAEQAHLVNATERDIHTAEEYLDDIEENISGLEAMLAGETNWNPALAFKMYTDAQKLVNRTFGETEENVIVAGIESFTDTETAKIKAIEGLESIKEKAASIGKGIAEFFKNLYKHVIAVFVGLFDRLKGIAKRSDALISRLNGLSDDKIKDTIKLGKWNAYLEIETTNDPLRRITAINNIVKRLGTSLNESKGKPAFDIITNSLTAIYEESTNKNVVDSNDDYTVSLGKIAYIEFRYKIPKVLAFLRNASLSYKIASDAVVSGERKTSRNKASLILLAKSIKAHALEAQEKTYSASKLSSFRDKAINTVKAFASTGETRKEAQAIREAHIASNNIARTLKRYQGDVLMAGQQYISAHF